MIDIITPIPCKDCISYAMCNSMFKDTDDLHDAIHISRSLINKCSIIRNHLTKFHKIYFNLYDNVGVVITVNTRPFINTFVNKSVILQLSKFFLTVKIVYSRYGIYTALMT